MLQVTAAIIQHHGRVLLARRKQPTWLAGKWEFPGGKIERGEAPQAALARELVEELGLRVEVGEHLITHRHSYPQLKLELAAYLVHFPDSVETPELTLSDHDAVCWKQPRELLEMELAPADIPIAEALVARMDASS